MTPRPYQLEAVERARQVIRIGKMRVILALPTGGGKTVIASYIIARAVARGQRVLFLAHRRELIKQCFQKLIAGGLLPSQVGIIMAGIDALGRASAPFDADASADDLWKYHARRRPMAPVQVASIDTLRNRPKPEAHLVFVDECHRALAKGYLDMQQAYPKAVHLGLSATPYRADGKGLGMAYDEIVTVATPMQLIGEGFLVEPEVYTVPAADLPDLKKIKIKGGDYDAEQLVAAVDREGLVGNIVEHWQKLAGDRRTVVFACNVAHSKHITERFLAAGVAAEHLDGETPTPERDAILARLERGETRVVCNCGVLCEGWDMPSVKCCVLARPTKSLGLYLQQGGRVLRPWENATALILDHAGCVLEHGLPQEEREFSLDGQKRKKLAAPSVKMCEACYAIVPSATRFCPRCGVEMRVDDGSGADENDPLVEADGSLVQVTAASEADKKAFFAELLTEAETRGYQPGWAAYRYKERMGIWPPKGWGPKRAPVEAPDETKRAFLAQLRETARQHGYMPGWAVARFKARFGHDIPAAWLVSAALAHEIAKQEVAC